MLGVESATVKPGVGFETGELSGFDKLGCGFLEEVECLGHVEVVEDEGLGGGFDVGESGVGHERGEFAPDPASGEAVGPGVEDAPGDLAVGGVDGEGFPVVVVGDEDAAGSEDPGRLAEDGQGVGDMLEDAVNPAGVDAGVGEREGSALGNLEAEIGDVGVAGSGGVDHGLAEVEANHLAVGGHQRGDVGRVVAESAADVDDGPTGGGVCPGVAEFFDLGEEGVRLDECEAGGEGLEVARLVDVLEGRGEVVAQDASPI